MGAIVGILFSFFGTGALVAFFIIVPIYEYRAKRTIAAEPDFETTDDGRFYYEEPWEYRRSRRWSHFRSPYFGPGGRGR